MNLSTNGVSVISGYSLQTTNGSALSSKACNEFRPLGEPTEQVGALRDGEFIARWHFQRSHHIDIGAHPLIHSGGLSSTNTGGLNGDAGLLQQSIHNLQQTPV